MIEGSISNRIRYLRFQKGEMSQSELGQRIGVTRQTIAAIEAGKYSPSLGGRVPYR
jgi:putative transcriptional regulator